MDNFVYHEKWKDPKTGRYIKHVYTLDEKPVTGVTTVLSIIAKQLTGWAGRVDASVAFQKAYEMDFETLGHLVSRLSQFPNISSEDAEIIGKEFPEYDEARCAHDSVKDKAADQGTDTHAEIEEWVKECIEKDALMFDGICKSPALRSFQEWAVHNNIRFIESEKRMYSREWWVAGTTDLVFEKDGQRFVGDVKTMKKLWDVTPFIQCAAYAKMLMEMSEYYDPKMPEVFKLSEKPTIDGTCVINIPKETNKVETFYRYDLENDIKAFESALYLYRTLNP